MATILIVDDRPTNRQVLTTLLGYGGHRLLEASDGAEALKIARAERPNLIITDILMPTMDGFELTQQVRADPALATTPVIFYTATYRASQARVLAQACGVKHVLAKPAEPKEILETVQAVLGIREVAPPPPATPPVVPPSAEPLRKITDKFVEHMDVLQGIHSDLSSLIHAGKEIVKECERLNYLADAYSHNAVQLQATSLRLTTLVELLLDLGLERDSSNLIETFCSASRRVLNASYAVVVLLKEDERTPLRTVTSSLDDETAARFVPLSLDSGLLRQLCDKRRPLRQSGIGDPSALGFPPEHPPLRSFLGVPLCTSTQLYGVLYLADKHDADEFDENDEQIVTTLAAQTAVAYENLQLYDLIQSHAADLQLEVDKRKRAEAGMQQQLTRISLLNQIAHAVLERHDLRSLFQAVLTRLEDELPIDVGGVSLYDSPTDTLTIIARGLKSQSLAAEVGVNEGSRVPVGQTPFRPCLNGEVVYISDTARADAQIPQRFAESGIRSVVGVPLMVEGQTYGILAVGRREVDGFNSAEREFLRALGEQVALAAHQTRLHNELQQTYDDLRQTQQAVMEQERLRALGQMASGIAHDINNALSPIAGYAELLLLDEPNLSERSQRYLNIIKTAAGDITHTVARMKEFYRQREGGDMLFPCDMNQVVPQVIDLTRAKWRDDPQEKGIVIEVRTDLQDDLPSVMGIASEIREALINLIFNAVDAMPEGGTITVRTRMGVWEYGSMGETTPPHLPTPTHVVLEVSDTGIGMDEETRRHCLEPFYTTKGERGTGLGLAMVFGIMQRHNGRVEIESALGKGTTVRLIFPLNLEDAMSASYAEESNPATPPMRILFIDDEPALRAVVQDMLTSDGHTVEVADSGLAGMEAFRGAQERSEPFDVVITDLGMPHTDGRAVARVVKSVSSTTPVILLTGWGARLHAERSIPNEVDAVLNKPPSTNELRRALAKVRAKK